MRFTPTILLCLATSAVVAAPIAAQGLAPAPSAIPAGMAAAVATRAGDGYLLGANDEVEVTIFGTGQGQVVKQRIKEDGTISLPYLGTIAARDRTPRQLATSVTEQLRSGGYFVKPVVNVEVTQYVSNAVTVLGQVGNSGIFPLDRPMTVGMMIARAGGARGDGADYAILRRTGDPEEHRILLSELIGPWSGETALRAGDTLYVPVAPTIYIYGQVNQPGQVVIKSGMTLRQVLARAGGPTLAGSTRNISIHRGESEIKRVKLDSPILPGDTIFIHERLF